MSSYSLSKFFRSPFPLTWLLYLALGLSLLGFVDASYLTILHYKNAIPPCTLRGCEVVLTSTYATVWGIPIALVGAGFYLTLAILAGILLSSPIQSGIQKNIDSRFPAWRQAWRGNDRGRQAITLLFLLLSTAGLVVGIVLVGIQAFILHSFCQYCLASELIDFLLFDTGWWIFNSFHKES